MSDANNTKKSQKGLSPFAKNGPTEPSPDEKTFEGYTTDEVIDAIARIQTVTRESAASLFEKLPREKIQVILKADSMQLPETPTKVPSEVNSPPAGLSVIPQQSAEMTPYPKNAILQPILTIEEATANVKFMERVIKELLKPDIHYGIPKKDGRPIWGKKALYKAGASFLGRLFGLKPDYVELVCHEDQENFDYRYKIRCDLIRISTGQVVSTAVGACSSSESRFTRKDQKAYLKPDMWHTVLAVAQKRALVLAVKYATGADEYFAEDSDKL
jgi:hypothetical protein